MEKKWLLLLMIPLLILVGCGKEETKEATKASNSKKGMVIKDEGKKRSDIINNMLIGKTKINFNNAPYDKMSDGKFTQNELWGTFQNKSDRDITIQINASDNLQKIYGDIVGYQLEGVEWEEEEIVQYLGIMEEALQSSKDGKTLMYKARTGDVIFSVAMFGKNKLTEENRLELKRLAKGIKIEYAEGQIQTNS